MRQRHPETILNRLDWTVIKRLDGLLQGDYRTLFQGFGLDLAELREYTFGDDVRHIDWNVTARLAEPHVRRFNEDREVEAWFLLDLSSSVNFGTAEARKRDQLIDFFAVLSRILSRHGNRVGTMVYDGADVRVLPARSGKIHLLSLIDEATRTEAATGETDLGVLLAVAERILRRRALIFVVSDFISLPGWTVQLGRLVLRHEVLAIRLFDPREEDLPSLGMVVLEDAETGDQLFVDTTDARFRRRFADSSSRRIAGLDGAFRAAGVDSLLLSTEDDLVRRILSFAESRRDRRRL